MTGHSGASVPSSLTQLLRALAPLFDGWCCEDAWLAGPIPAADLA